MAELIDYLPSKVINKSIGILIYMLTAFNTLQSDKKEWNSYE